MTDESFERSWTTDVRVVGTHAWMLLYLSTLMQNSRCGATRVCCLVYLAWSPNNLWPVSVFLSCWSFSNSCFVLLFRPEMLFYAENGFVRRNWPTVLLLWLLWLHYFGGWGVSGDRLTTWNGSSRVDVCVLMFRHDRPVPNFERLLLWFNVILVLWFWINTLFPLVWKKLSVKVK